MAGPSGVSDLKLFVSDEAGTRGPLSGDDIRRAMSSGQIKPGARFRFSETQAWLPAGAWEAFADLAPAVPVPSAPQGDVPAQLPQIISEISPKNREHLLWFVADMDGVMGPVSGEYVVKGIRIGKFPLRAAVCLAASATWVRAASAFPAALEGATTVRKLPIPTAPCLYCLHPVALGDTACTTCGEQVRPASITKQLLLIVATVAVVTVISLAIVVITRPRAAHIPAVASSATAIASASTKQGDDKPAGSRSEGVLSRITPPKIEQGHLETGQIAARIDVDRNVVDALAVSKDLIASARPDAVEVVDARTGAPLFAALQLASVQALFPAGSYVYAVIGTRLAAVDASTVRIMSWIDLGVSPLGVAVASEANLALVADAASWTVSVLDAHAEVARLSFDGPIGLAAVDDRGTVALGGAGDPRDKRPAEALVVAFHPNLGISSSQRFIRLSEAPSAVAVSADGSYGAVTLRKAGEIVRIDLRPEASLAYPIAGIKTCAEPNNVVIGAGVVVVACRSGREAVLHDGKTFEKLKTFDLGGPALGLEISPDRVQALITVGSPSPGVALIDLVRRDVRMMATSEPSQIVRYGLGGRIATALVPRAGRILVFR